MTIYRLDDRIPRIHPSAWVADNATVVGEVELEEEASVWFGAILRGDSALIRIGKRSNVQDGSVVHADEGIPATIGDDVTVGHLVMLHGCTIGDGTLDRHRRGHPQPRAHRQELPRRRAGPRHRRQGVPRRLAHRRLARRSRCAR